MQKLQYHLQKLLDLLFPQQCVACKCSGYVLCPTCQANIQPLTPPFCHHCSSRLTLDGICRKCRYHPLNMNGLRAVGTYEEPLRTCIHALKYDGKTQLAEPLGNLLAKAYVAYGLQIDVIIPVPLHSERLQQRGYNQAVLLARQCALQIAIPIREDILIRQRATPAQVGLVAQERQQNVTGAFVCNPAFARGALHKRKVLIIDDVCTTGATLEACTAPLFAAGALEVWGLVLALPV